MEEDAESLVLRTQGKGTETRRRKGGIEAEKQMGVGRAERCRDARDVRIGDRERQQGVVAQACKPST